MSQTQSKTDPSTSYGSDQILWDLSDLYNDLSDPAIEDTMSTAQLQAKAFQKRYKGQLAQLSGPELADCFNDYETIRQAMSRLGQYAHLVFATDTSNQVAKQLVAKIDESDSYIQNDLLFFHLELSAFSSDRLKTLQQDPALSDLTYYLTHAHQTAQYNLSEAEEKVINLKDLTGSQALCKLYEELTASYEFDFELDGKVQKMNGSQLRALRQDLRPDVRRRAMRTFLARYEQDTLIHTHLFNHIVKDYGIERELRGYDSAISIRNTQNDLPDDLIQLLHDVTKESYPLVQNYYQKKSSILGLSDMSLADIYAPIQQSEVRFSWEEAKDIVLSGLSRFDDEFYEKAKLIFDQNRIHAPIMSKKRGGAFCSCSSPDIAPYVMLNYQGRTRDVATLAHELGHGIHDLFACKQRYVNYHPILPLAETASVFTEMIITDLLLSEIKDPAARQALIADKLEDIFATSHRQNVFSSFELATHSQIDSALQSPDQLCDQYMRLVKEMFGDSVQYPDEFKWEWSAIPHIFEWPFYVYAYNFGNLLVMALYEQYKQQGPDMIVSLKEILSAGSAASPIEITQKAGIDITKRDFWVQSLGAIERLLAQF